MPQRPISGDSARQHAHLSDSPLHLAYSKKRTLGDKLHELAFRSPKYIVAVETLVDYLLSTFKQA